MNYSAFFWLLKNPKWISVDRINICIKKTNEQSLSKKKSEKNSYPIESKS